MYVLQNEAIKFKYFLKIFLFHADYFNLFRRQIHSDGLFSGNKDCNENVRKC